METITGATQFHIKGQTAVSLGKFDGLHRGHRKLLSHILNKRGQGLKSVVFTFDVPPSARLTGREPKVLLTNEERRRMLAGMGVDYLIECPFIPEISHMEPERFVREILCEQLGMSYLAVGTDFRFGYERGGDAALLERLSSRLGYEVQVVEKERDGAVEVSSSYIKEALGRGDMELAARLLGYPYAISGEVVHGRHMGREVLGIPTVNLLPPKAKLLPPDGVYVSKIFIRGKCYGGITNIGCKPTVEAEVERGVETHIFDFDEEIYGLCVRVQLLAFVRPEQRFSSLTALTGQMRSDIRFGMEYLRAGR